MGLEKHVVPKVHFSFELEVVKLLFWGRTGVFMRRKKEEAELVCSPGHCSIRDTEISAAKEETSLIRF